MNAAATPSPRRRLHPSGLVGAALLTLLGVASLSAPWLAPRAPDAVDLRRRLQPPSWSEPLGTDELGRSTLARVLHGGRISLLAGALAILGATVAGGAIGAVAGTAPGRVDGLLMRGVDALLVCPPLLLARAIVGALGPDLRNAALALAIVETPVFARLTRSIVVVARELPYVEAAVAGGARPWRVLVRHVLPVAVAPLTVQFTLGTGFAIVAFSGLSFLGLGTPPPTADWGEMLARSRHYLLDAPWLLAAPGLAVTASVLGCNLLGDALRDALGVIGRPGRIGRRGERRVSARRI